MPHDILPSACPHDCPSCCALDVEKIDARTVGRLHGAKDNPYTAGVICAKVARYAERVHHPDRLRRPLRRVGAKGEGRFEPVSWDDALDIAAEAFTRAADRHGAEAVWPYYYAGTMGLLQRDGLERLRRAMGYSALGKTICSAVGKAGWTAGVGALRGVDPREMADSDLIVLWGVNAVATQVNVMTHVSRARKERGATVVCIDPYRNATAAFADIHLPLRPGTDGALACAVMHVLFKEGFADRAYLADYADDPDRLERHLDGRTPAWAAAITGLSEQQIVDFARLYGATERAYIRLGYGFTRTRNGAANMHAVSCLPTVRGAWRHRGGGATFSNGGLYAVDKTLIEGLDLPSKNERTIDMCRLGDALAGDAEALSGGPPVAAMIVQNSNPAVVAPDSGRVQAGFLRDDLFLCVHEQFLTKTARLADVILPATTFLEHPDIYTGGGHTFLHVVRPVIEPYADCRSNHQVLQGLAARLGADHPGFAMTAWEAIDATLKASGLAGADAAADGRWVDFSLPFETAHFLDGFGHPDGRFRFVADWPDPVLPALPDHVDLIEAADDAHPFRLVTAPSHDYLNTTFNETPSSQRRQPRPFALLHRDDCADLGLTAGGRARLGNRRGSVVVDVKSTDGQQRGVVVVEGIFPDEAFEEGVGINLLVGEDPIPPTGGGAFHDTAVWVKPA